jgi:hypothetical protein
LLEEQQLRDACRSQNSCNAFSRHLRAVMMPNEGQTSCPDYLLP